MPQLFPIAAITDEFSPDLSTAVQSMSEVGMTAAELRVVFGKNIIDLTDEELNRAQQIVAGKGLKIISIASPLLKCVLPDAPPIDSRFQQDIFASRHTFEDQPRLTERAFEIARRTGARIVRVFSYWRTIEPGRCFERIVTALRGLAEKAVAHDLIIGLENEHACNIATGAETARLLEAIDHPRLQVVWDPCNALVSGESPFPQGYRQLPPGRIAHVHAKDCFVNNHTPTFGPLGECGIDWKGQIRALVDDGYRGFISLETHWAGPGGDKHTGSMICGRNLKTLVTA
ncbi:MAG TPA: sugar phosphate isomerase/epimerase family protein [Bryobacteraceae bacterium]|nr:sugar phosphate isomerase/epimerase family protein [Bryobacteraceae bacterium]